MSDDNDNPLAAITTVDLVREVIRRTGSGVLATTQEMREIRHWGEPIECVRLIEHAREAVLRAGEGNVGP